MFLADKARTMVASAALKRRGIPLAGTSLRSTRGGSCSVPSRFSRRRMLTTSSYESAGPSVDRLVGMEMNRARDDRWHYGLALATAFAATVAAAATATTGSLAVRREERARKLVDSLRQAVGTDHVSVDEDSLVDHGTPKFSYHQSDSLPDVIVSPATTEEVVEIVKVCSDLGVPMIPYGGATSLEGHLLVPVGGCSIDFARMKDILHLSREDHVVTVQPGLGYVELNQILKAHGLWFPLDPGPGASLGGMCSCSCSGSTAVRYGTMKDNVVSMKVVLANGEVVKTSSSAKKSSAGYDLTRLFVGSEGTLGIITELTIKVHKIPAYSNAVRIPFESVDAAAKAVQDTLAAGIQIGRAEMMDETMVDVLNEANGTKHPNATTVLFELAGESLASVADAQSAVLALARKRGGGTPHVATTPQECEEMWRHRKEALWSLMGKYPDLECMITDVCVPVSRLSDLVTASKRELNASPLPAPIVAHAGDGNFHALIMFDRDDPEAVAEADRLSSFMVHKALDMDGTCTGEHGVGVGKIKYLPEEHGPGAMYTMRVIKRALDPDGLMNPGKVLEHRRDPRTGRLVLCV